MGASQANAATQKNKTFLLMLANAELTEAAM